MTIAVIIVTLAVALFIAYKLNKQTPQVEVNNAPDKIEPPVLVKKTLKEEPKKMKKTEKKVEEKPTKKLVKKVSKNTK